MAFYNSSPLWEAKPALQVKEKIFILNKKESSDGCVRFKKVQQQESELQSSNPLPSNS